MDSPEGISIIYRLEGKDISLDKAPADIIGKILLDMQGLVSSIGQYYEEKEYINKKKAKDLSSNFNLSVSFKSGSLALAFVTPFEQQIIGTASSLQENAFSTMANIFATLSEEDKNDIQVKKEIDKLIDDPATRYRMYSHAKGLLPVRKDYNASINFTGTRKKTGSIILNKNIIRSRINNGLLEKTPNIFEIEEKGAIVGVRIDPPNPHFVLKQIDGHYTRIPLEETMKPEIIKYFVNKSPIKIRGMINKERGQMSKMMEISHFEECRNLSIDSAKEKILSNPIETVISYEESGDFWILSNEDLGINAIGKNVHEAQSNFEESLILDYEEYKDIPDDDLTEDAVILKQKLISLFERRD